MAVYKFVPEPRKVKVERRSASFFRPTVGMPVYDSRRTTSLTRIGQTCLTKSKVVRFTTIVQSQSDCSLYPGRLYCFEVYRPLSPNVSIFLSNFLQPFLHNYVIMGVKASPSQTYIEEAIRRVL